MPPVSEKQRRAMRAAASGQSTLGIPPSVGKDFSDADPGGKLPSAAPSERQSNLKGPPRSEGTPSPTPARGLSSLVRGSKGKDK